MIDSAMVSRAADTRSGAPWHAARRIAYEAGWAAQRDPAGWPLAACDGTTLAADIRARTALPAFPTACLARPSAIAARTPTSRWSIVIPAAEREPMTPHQR